ncbi:hypothetical protein POM88_001104 [Heracleum sosnowskyi]|uniref:Uncharacterized protein n=1 Tax=Heracleum sosnowskyi TaxID=360622 RepID=A0AAD8JCC3_9APIA|nr:hypothetical protein POM88_001104 [Heracleum sosnowskyi]
MLFGGHTLYLTFARARTSPINILPSVVTAKTVHTTSNARINIEQNGLTNKHHFTTLDEGMSKNAPEVIPATQSTYFPDLKINEDYAKEIQNSVILVTNNKETMESVSLIVEGLGFEHVLVRGLNCKTFIAHFLLEENLDVVWYKLLEKENHLEQDITFARTSEVEGPDGVYITQEKGNSDKSAVGINSEKRENNGSVSEDSEIDNSRMEHHKTYNSQQQAIAGEIESKCGEIGEFPRNQQESDIEESTSLLNPITPLTHFESDMIEGVLVENWNWCARDESESEVTEMNSKCNTNSSC